MSVHLIFLFGLSICDCFQDSGWTHGWRICRYWYGEMDGVTFSRTPTVSLLAPTAVMAVYSTAEHRGTLSLQVAWILSKGLGGLLQVLSWHYMGSLFCLKTNAPSVNRLFTLPKQAFSDQGGWSLILSLKSQTGKIWAQAISLGNIGFVTLFAFTTILQRLSKYNSITLLHFFQQSTKVLLLNKTRKYNIK